MSKTTEAYRKRREKRTYRLALKLIEEYAPGRSCEGCTVCCTVMRVPEVQKDLFEPCKYVTDTGCGCYESRPHACYVWACDWREGMFGGERPDVSGIMVNGRRLADGSIRQVVVESRQGALDEPDNIATIDAAAKLHNVYVFRFESVKGWNWRTGGIVNLGDD